MQIWQIFKTFVYIYEITPEFDNLYYILMTYFIKYLIPINFTRISTLMTILFFDNLMMWWTVMQVFIYAQKNSPELNLDYLG